VASFQSITGALKSPSLSSPVSLLQLQLQVIWCALIYKIKSSSSVLQSVELRHQHRV